MFKRLRRRFVLLVGISVFIFIFLIITISNIINYKRVAEEADQILNVLAINDGVFSDKPFPDDKFDETPFETRFFTVRYTKKGIMVNTKQNSIVNDQKAIEFAETVKNQSRKNGYVDVYRYKIVEKGGDTLVIFINWSRQLETANVFLIVSSLVSLLVYIIVLMFAYVLAHRLLAPIADSYEKQTRFITNASHEIKTPLTIISANNELLELEYGESDSTKAINKQIKRLNQMVRSMTVLSKIQKNGKLNIVKFSLSEAINEIIGSFNCNGIKINMHITNDLYYYGDEGLIRQLISILLDNAIKYSISYINIFCKKLNNKIVMMFQNDVINHENENTKKYFERFFRSQTSRSSNVEGSGIGLSIALEIVNVHNGHINIKEKDNEFSIKVTL